MNRKHPSPRRHRDGAAALKASDGATETLTGTVDHIVYRSEETGYTVCVLKTTGHRDGLTVVGTCATIWAGETLTVEGQWTRHKLHGV